MFDRAIERQRGWDYGHRAKTEDTLRQSFRRTAVVFMDEAGLPEEAKESLKVLHYYLDDPAVGFVAITNRPLDAAKMNRAVVLFRPAADRIELGLLLAGSLNRSPSEATTSVAIMAFRDAYARLMEQKSPLSSHTDVGIVFRDRYGLRDFYNFGRYFTRPGKSFPPSPAELLHAIERNFNGMSLEDFKVVAKKFFAEWESANGSEAPEAAAEQVIDKLHIRSVVEVLREALSDHNVDEKRMNETIVRYTLVLDETADDSAARLMFQCGILDRTKTIVYNLSNFPADQNDVVKSTLISNIKHAMLEGKTLFLMHTAPIHGSLYDLLNQHFTPMQKRDGSIAYYANVAIGSYSRPCQVHKDFRLIVHKPENVMAPPPFYNRFEKYLLTVKNMWDDVRKSSRLQAGERKALKRVAQQVGDRLFVMHVDVQGVIGFKESNTVESVLLSKVLQLVDRQTTIRRLTALVDAIGQGAAAVKAWSKLGVAREENSTDLMVAPGSIVYDKLVYEVAATVLQLATPETMLDAQLKLPPVLTQMYLDNQEHFNLSKVVCDVSPRVPGRTASGEPNSAVEAAYGTDIKGLVDACLYRYACCCCSVAFISTSRLTVLPVSQSCQEDCRVHARE